MTGIQARLATALADRYTIERELGQGGMATVYLAHDVRHDRKVALKVLRPELAAILGGERFLKEIRTTANLQHPHILALHDSGEAEGLVYYVMPYVEGESLRDRLNREKQLPVDEAVRIAREVADALDYAHQHGIVHRDIKPENILLQGGHAMVADFGIALAASRSDGGTRMTETGMSLGTPHYMAPEQAMGEREITPKADIYALGCVLYELLSGEPPFNGPTAQAIVARVMTDQPRPLTLQRHTIPPYVEAAVNCALEKLPADRFATAQEFAEALGNPAFATAARPAERMTAVPSRRRAGLFAGGLVAGALLTAFALAVLRPQPPAPVRRFGLAFPANQAPLVNRQFALAPDGSALAYVGPGVGGGVPQLWVKRRDRHDAEPLAGTVNVTNFTFSPDSRWIAYMQQGELKKVSLDGGAAITLADSVSTQPGLAWSDDGHLIFVRTGGRQLRRVPEAGGPDTTVWRMTDSGAVRFPAALPGGRGFLFATCRGTSCADDQALWVVDLRSGEGRMLHAGAARGTYVPTGHVIFVRRDGAMMALPFNPRSLAASGSPVPIMDSVAVENGQIPFMAVSDEGTLVIRTGSQLSSFAWYQAVWVDRTGVTMPVDTSWTFRLTGYGNNNGGWSLSPDGSRLAIGLETEAGDDIWVKQLPRGALSRVSLNPAPEFRPRWLSDGRTVTFHSLRGPNIDLFQRRADGTGADSLILDRPVAVLEAAWSGSWLVYRPLSAEGRRNIYGINGPARDTTQRPLVANPGYDEYAAAVSPDGRWLAYVSNETGRHEVYVRPFPSTDSGKWQVSIQGGIAPLWSRNGRELFLVDAARRMVAVPVAPGPVFRAGEGKPLFRLSDDLYGSTADYYTPHDASPDGRRFLMAMRTRTEAVHVPMVVTENWFTDLRQKTRSR